MLRQNIDIRLGVEVMFMNSIEENCGPRIKPALPTIDYARAQPTHVPHTLSVQVQRPHGLPSPTVVQGDGATLTGRCR